MSDQLAGVSIVKLKLSQLAVTAQASGDENEKRRIKGRLDSSNISAILSSLCVFAVSLETSLALKAQYELRCGNNAERVSSARLKRSDWHAAPAGGRRFTTITSLTVQTSLLLFAGRGGALNLSPRGGRMRAVLRHKSFSAENLASHTEFWLMKSERPQVLRPSRLLFPSSDERRSAAPPTAQDRRINQWRTCWETSTWAPMSPLRWPTWACRRNVSQRPPAGTQENYMTAELHSFSFSFLSTRCSLSCLLTSFLSSHSFERGVAPAGRAQAPAAHRAPPTGEPAGGLRRCVPAFIHGQEQRAEPDAHVQLPGPGGSEGLQRSTVSLALQLFRHGGAVVPLLLLFTFSCFLPETTKSRKTDGCLDLFLHMMTFFPHISIFILNDFCPSWFWVWKKDICTYYFIKYQNQYVGISKNNNIIDTLIHLCYAAKNKT